tara:strand:- start:443 stop:649 length:207 start_codon:yes stop_codon:yes gene_type:complete
MDFLEELIILNNMITLRKKAIELNLTEEDEKLFIIKYNKSNNRLFTPCKQYMIDEYKDEVTKYKSTTQ